jgi:hypothetical protein
MPAEPRELAHGRQRRLEAFDGPARAQPSEITGADGGEKIKPQIGGRGAVSQGGGIFLEIVRRQHVVFRRHEPFEKTPRATRR